MPDIADQDETGGGKGGKGSGGIEFHYHDALISGPERADQIDKLPPEEKKRLLSNHKELNDALLEKQKKLRDQRKEAKEGKTAGYQLGSSYGSESLYKQHPLISQSPEFDGIDHQVNLDPSRYEAETNPEKQAELTYEHQLRYDLQNQPERVFNPNPRPS